MEEGFEFVDHAAEMGGRIAQTADCAEASGIGNGGCKGGSGSVGHAGKEDWVGQREERMQWGTQLRLWVESHLFFFLCGEWTERTAES